MIGQNLFDNKPLVLITFHSYSLRESDNLFVMEFYIFRSKISKCDLIYIFCGTVSNFNGSAFEFSDIYLKSLMVTQYQNSARNES